MGPSGQARTVAARDLPAARGATPQSAPLEYIANLLVLPSYVSLERALSFHGLIPERVPPTAAGNAEQATSSAASHGVAGRHGAHAGHPSAHPHHGRAQPHEHHAADRRARVVDRFERTPHDVHGADHADPRDDRTELVKVVDVAGREARQTGERSNASAVWQPFTGTTTSTGWTVDLPPRSVTSMAGLIPATAPDGAAGSDAGTGQGSSAGGCGDSGHGASTSGLALGILVAGVLRRRRR
jgi:hypothetical protein